MVKRYKIEDYIIYPKESVQYFEFAIAKGVKLSIFGKYNCKFENFRLEIWSVHLFVLNLQSQN